MLQMTLQYKGMRHNNDVQERLVTIIKLKGSFPRPRCGVGSMSSQDRMSIRRRSASLSRLFQLRFYLGHLRIPRVTSQRSKIT